MENDTQITPHKIYMVLETAKQLVKLIQTTQFWKTAYKLDMEKIGMGYKTNGKNWNGKAENNLLQYSEWQLDMIA